MDPEASCIYFDSCVLLKKNSPVCIFKKPLLPYKDNMSGSMVLTILDDGPEHVAHVLTEIIHLIISNSFKFEAADDVNNCLEQLELSNVCTSYWVTYGPHVIVMFKYFISIIFFFTTIYNI